jgi:DNA-binding GntR family transcriptional regulator
VLDAVLRGDADGAAAAMAAHADRDLVPAVPAKG